MFDNDSNSSLFIVLGQSLFKKQLMYLITKYLSRWTENSMAAEDNFVYQMKPRKS